MKPMKTLALAGCVAIAFAGSAYAQSDMTPANKEYMQAMEKMNKEMMAATDQDPAKSFAKKMIAHHQGAIEMSQIALIVPDEPMASCQPRAR